MNKFCVTGIAATNKGIIIFQERNKKKVKKSIRIYDKKPMIIFQKNIRKGKGNYFYKLAITGLSELKIEANYIKAGVINE